MSFLKSPLIKSNIALSSSIALLFNLSALKAFGNSLKKYEIFFSYSNAIPCLHCVLEGYWRWYPYLWCKKNGIRLTFDTYKRPHLIRTIYSVVKAVLFNIVLKCLPEIYKKYSEKKYGKGIAV